jgi:hypothetical protein
VETVRSQLHPGEDFTTELCYTLFGAKYVRMPGSRVFNTIFNGQDLYSTVDGEHVFLDHEIAAVHEGELDCITFRQELGIPCVATGRSNQLQWATRKVGLLVIVKDNDPTRLVNGRLVSAGQEHARRTLRATERDHGVNAVVVSPYPGYKDCNALHQAGLLATW